MKAGRELDALVAEKVMDWQKVVKRPSHWHELRHLVNTLTGAEIKPYQGPWWILPHMDIKESPDNGVELPYYSTDIAAAWEVVEKICSGIGDLRITVAGDMHLCEIWSPATGNNMIADVEEETAPEAICLAALEALEALKKK